MFGSESIRSDSNPFFQSEILSHQWSERDRIHQLEKTLKLQQQKYRDLLQRQQSLKEDFQFNLKLIKERDTELNKFDTIVAEYAQKLQTKESQLTQLTERNQLLGTKGNSEIQSLKKQLDHQKTAVNSQYEMKIDNLTKAQTQQIAQLETQLQSTVQNNADYSQQILTLEQTVATLHQTIDKITFESEQIKKESLLKLKQISSQLSTEKARKETLAQSYELKMSSIVNQLETVQNQIGLDRTTYDSKIDSLLKELDQKNQKINQLSLQMAQQNQTLESKHSQLRRQFDSGTAVHSREKQMLSSEIEALKETLTDAEEKLRSMSQHLTEEKLVNSNQTDSFTQLQSQIESLRQQHRSERSQWKDERSALQREVSSLQFHSNAKSTEIETLTSQLDALQSKHDNLHSAELPQMRESCQQLRNENQKMVQKNRDLHNQNEKIRNVTREMRRTIEQLHQISTLQPIKPQSTPTLIDLTAKPTQLQNENNAFRQKIAQNNQKIDLLKAKLTKAKSENTILRKEKSQSEEINNKLHYQLLSSSNEKSNDPNTTVSKVNANPTAVIAITSDNSLNNSPDTLSLKKENAETYRKLNERRSSLRQKTQSVREQLMLKGQSADVKSRRRQHRRHYKPNIDNK